MPHLLMKKNVQVIDRRNFIKKSALGIAGLSLAPALLAEVGVEPAPQVLLAALGVLVETLACCFASAFCLGGCSVLRRR